MWASSDKPRDSIGALCMKKVYDVCEDVRVIVDVSTESSKYVVIKLAPRILEDSSEVG